MAYSSFATEVHEDCWTSHFCKLCCAPTVRVDMQVDLLQGVYCFKPATRLVVYAYAATAMQ